MHAFTLALLFMVVIMSSRTPAPPPTSLLGGRVTFELPSSWHVREATDRKDDGELQLTVPQPGPDRTPAIATLRARRVAADVTVRQACARVASVAANPGPGRYIIGDMTEGEHWRTVLWSEREGEVVLGRFGVDGGVMVEFEVTLPFGKTEDPTWLTQVVGDFNSTCARLKIDGKTTFVSRIATDVSISFDPKVQTSSP
jgi:hypothetical protein